MASPTEPLPDLDVPVRTGPEGAEDAASVVRAVLATLNGLAVAEISRVHREIDRSRQSLAAIGQEELAARLSEAQGCLRLGDAKGFRRAVSNVTARLGHLK